MIGGRLAGKGCGWGTCHFCLPPPLVPALFLDNWLFCSVFLLISADTVLKVGVLSDLQVKHKTSKLDLITYINREKFF